MKKTLIQLLLILALTVFVFAAGAASDRGTTEIYDDLEDLEGKKIVVLSGSVFDDLVAQVWDDAEVIYVQDYADGVEELENSQADAIICDGPYARYLVSQNESLAILDEALEIQNFAAAFEKSEEGQALCEEFSEFVRDLKNDGTLDDMLSIWTDVDTEKPVIDFGALTGENGTIRLGTDITDEPFDYLPHGDYGGYEIDLVYRFCKEKGYGLEISELSFESLIPALTTGMVDMITNSLAITEERQELVLFSEILCEDRVVPVISTVRSSELAAESSGDSIIESVGKSFNKTFVEEDRWKLFLDGIARTMIITFCSLVFGTILAYLLYLWYWTGQKTARNLTVGYAWLMSRLPVVVLLLILYYVIFGGAIFSGTFVSVIGFTMIFTGTVFELIREGASSVDAGQTEAGISLGYTRYQTLKKIVMPQAVQHFIGSYKTEIINLINSTAVVGYVSVQDLTKVGDIVRSCTFEAFFPLIATAVIYLLLADLLILFVRLTEKKLFPVNRSEARILKGVKTDD